MIGKMTFLAGAAAGYVLGAKAGREQYEKIMAAAKQAGENPKIAHAVETVSSKGTGIISEAKDKIGDKVPGARSASAEDSSAGAAGSAGKPASSTNGSTAPSSSPSHM